MLEIPDIFGGERLVLNPSLRMEKIEYPLGQLVPIEIPTLCLVPIEIPTLCLINIVLVFSMGTDCAPLVANLFLFC